MFKKLDNKFYSKDTISLAKALLGKMLVRKYRNNLLSGIIVETEAYLHKNDLASHSAVGKTERNKYMFYRAGTAYIYFIYGVHYCFNVVSENEGKGAAILIRALEPIDGIEIMRKNRNQENIFSLTNGPAKLCQALKIDKSLNGEDFTSSEKIFLTESNYKNFKIRKTKRIGIKKSADKLLRFYIGNSRFVSKVR